MGSAQSTQTTTETENKTLEVKRVTGPATRVETTENATNLETIPQINDNEDGDDISALDEEEDDWLERLAILEDVRKLGKIAEFFLCPEKRVACDDCAGARCYFDRPSAPKQEEEEEERDLILEEMKQLKKLATDYLHPELPVEITDPCACGRNYFTRPSAPQYEEEKQMKVKNGVLVQEYDDLMNELAEEYDTIQQERNNVMEDMERLKSLAQDYLQPERAVQVNPLASYRNYFTRPSAAPQESLEESEERMRILADAQNLKKLAVDYMCPEKPVKTTDPCACGRNFFNRPSAPGHFDATHTYCEWVDHGFHHVVDHDHHYYWLHQSEEEEQEQQFLMDGDDEPHFELKETTFEVEPFKGGHAVDFVAKDFHQQHPQSPKCALLLTYGPQAA